MDLDDEEDQYDDDGHDDEDSGNEVEDDSEKTNESRGNDQDEEDDELEEHDSTEKKPSTTQSTDASTGKNINSSTQKAPNASKARNSVTKKGSKHEEQLEDEVSTGAREGLKDQDISAEDYNESTMTPQAVKWEDKKACPIAKAPKNEAGKRAMKVELKSPRKLGKCKPRGAVSPTREEIRAVLPTILEATLSDIFRQLEAHLKVDLMSRKIEVKSLMEEVINSMSVDSDDEEEDEKEGGGAQDGDEEAGDGEDGDDGDDDN